MESERMQFYFPTQVALLALVVPALLACLGAGVGNFVLHPHRPNALGALALGIAGSLVLVVVLVRTLRSGTLIASRDRVILRTVARTRRWAWSDIRSFEEEIRQVGVGAYRRRVLVIYLTDGQGHVCIELNQSPRQTPDRIADMAKRLNDMKASVSSDSGAETSSNTRQQASYTHDRRRLPSHGEADQGP